LLAKSIGLAKIPQYIAAMNMVPSDMRIMAVVRSHPAKLTPMKHKAGSREAVNV
jgi:hypothetical protein